MGPTSKGRGWEGGKRGKGEDEGKEVEREGGNGREGEGK